MLSCPNLTCLDAWPGPLRSLYNNIKPPSWLAPSTDFHLFKEGIQPKVVKIPLQEDLLVVEVLL